MQGRRELREKLAAAYRLLHMEGLMDHAGLAGARIPETGNLLLNPREMRGTPGWRDQASGPCDTCTTMGHPITEQDFHMAKKRSASILNRLQKLLEPTPEKPATRAGSAKRDEQQSPARSADLSTASASSPEPTPAGKKKAAKPWYRHRQRW